MTRLRSVRLQVVGLDPSQAAWLCPPSESLGCSPPRYASIPCAIPSLALMGRGLVQREVGIPGKLASRDVQLHSVERELRRRETSS